MLNRNRGNAKMATKIKDQLTGPNILRTWEGRTQNPVFAPSFALEGPDGNLYVVDEVGHQVYVLDEEFNIQKKIGEKGAGEGQFYYPGHLTFRDDGNYLFIADRWNHRVQVFDKEGIFIKAWGQYGFDKGQFNEPVGIAYLNELIYVSERSGGRIQAFTEEGKLVHVFESKGPTPGYYEGKSFKRNIHYQKWYRDCTRFNTFETLFDDHGFKQGQVEYPEKLFRNQEGIIVSDESNGEVFRFSHELIYEGRLNFSSLLKDVKQVVLLYVDDAGFFWLTPTEDPTNIIGVHGNEIKLNWNLDEDMQITGLTRFHGNFVLIDFWNGKLNLISK